MASTTFVNGTVVEASWLNDVNDFVYERSYVHLSSVPGADPTGVADSTLAMQIALGTGKLVYLDGVFRVDGGAIQLTNTPGIVGDGPLKSKLLIATAGHAITLPSNAGYGRRSVILENFSIDSTGLCDGYYAFYAGGVASGATPMYNSGINIRNIDIGVSGRFGGGFYIKDCFRLNVDNVGLNNVTHMIRIVGSVVQAKFRNVTANNDSQATTLSAYGISTEGATYSSGLLGPENIRFIDCSYILGDRAINHTQGLAVEFVNMDGETKDYGAYINAPCVVRGGVFGPSPPANSWTGVYRGVNISENYDGTIFEDVDVQVFRDPGSPSTSYGFDLGDGVSPVYGLIMQRCRVRGTVNSIAHAIRGRQLFDATISDCLLKAAVTTGTEIDISGCRRLFLERNRVTGGVITVNDGGEPTAYGTVFNNQCATLNTTLTSSDNWTIAANETASASTRLVGEAKGTFTGTVTGMTATVTGTMRYVLQGRQVTLFISGATGTSNATTMTITGLPASLFPNRQQDLWGLAMNSSATSIAAYRVKTDGVIELYTGVSLGAWTNTGTKGTVACTLTYSLE